MQKPEDVKWDLMKSQKLPVLWLLYLKHIRLNVTCLNNCLLLINQIIENGWKNHRRSGLGEGNANGKQGSRHNYSAEFLAHEEC